MNAACRAEDQEQLQVRHFRSVLYGAATALFVSAVVLWIVGSIHPAYFPLCWPVPGSHPATMICTAGGSAPSAADDPLVLGIGALTADDMVEAAQALNALPIPWVEPRDISNAVLFLASDEARYITGVTLPVDAGSTQK